MYLERIGFFVCTEVAEAYFPEGRDICHIYRRRKGFGHLFLQDECFLLCRLLAVGRKDLHTETVNLYLLGFAIDFLFEQHLYQRILQHSNEGHIVQNIGLLQGIGLYERGISNSRLQQVRDRKGVCFYAVYAVVCPKHSRQESHQYQ